MSCDSGIILAMESCGHPARPENFAKNFVRGELSHTGYVVRPINEDEVNIIYLAQLNPKGSVVSPVSYKSLQFPCLPTSGMAALNPCKSDCYKPAFEYCPHERLSAENKQTINKICNSSILLSLF